MGEHLLLKRGGGEGMGTKQMGLGESILRERA
jgi:hypothetical protein